MKTVVVTRDGSQSIADHLTETRGWLVENNIAARELTVLHVLRLRVVLRAAFDHDADADRFAAHFG